MYVYYSLTFIMKDDTVDKSAYSSLATSCEVDQVSHWVSAFAITFSKCKTHGFIDEEFITNCLIQRPRRSPLISLRPKSTNLVEEVAYLLPVKFVLFRSAVAEEKRWQPIRGPGGHLFSARPEKYKLGGGRWVIASCEVSWNSVQQ